MLGEQGVVEPDPIARQLIDGLDGQQHDDETLYAAWQFLIDSGAVWTLQGWYRRTARDLIAAGICTLPETVNGHDFRKGAAVKKA